VVIFQDSRKKPDILFVVNGLQVRCTIPRREKKQDEADHNQNRHSRVPAGCGRDDSGDRGHISVPMLAELLASMSC